MATFRTLKDTSQRDRELRRDDTQARLWDALRARRLGGRRWDGRARRGRSSSVSMCVEAGPVVEVDGGQHSEQAACDERRAAYVVGLGLRVLRIWNSAMLTNRDGVCLTILEACGGERAAEGPG